MSSIPSIVVLFQARVHCFQLNSGQFAEQFRGNDLNVEPAWIQGYSGCNVTVAVVDDGK